LTALSCLCTRARPAKHLHEPEMPRILARRPKLTPASKGRFGQKQLFSPQPLKILFCLQLPGWSTSLWLPFAHAGRSWSVHSPVSPAVSWVKARLPFWTTQNRRPHPLLTLARLPSLTLHALPSARLIEEPSQGPFLAPDERGRNSLPLNLLWSSLRCAPQPQSHLGCH
jgi:hypothetical protein